LTRLHALATAAMLLAAPPAAGFVRSSDGCTQVCLYWDTRTPTWKANLGRMGQSDTCSPTVSSDPVLVAMRAGFDAWSHAAQSGQPACTDYAPVYGGTTSNAKSGSDGENVVLLRNGPCSAILAPSDPCWGLGTCENDHDCFDDSGARAGIVAFTIASYDPSTGRILDADIELKGWDGIGAGSALSPAGSGHGTYFTCIADLPYPNADFQVPFCANYGDPDCWYIDLQSVVTHEAGHFLGLAHPPVPEATMYATMPVGETKKRTLYSDDVSGVCTIYPAGAAAVTCPAQNLSSCLGSIGGDGKKGGCQSAAGLGPLAVFGLVALLRRLRSLRAS
jgi:hypothetical protein